jgi:hypothetical protein
MDVDGWFIELQPCDVKMRLAELQVESAGCIDEPPNPFAPLPVWQMSLSKRFLFLEHIRKTYQHSVSASSMSFKTMSLGWICVLIQLLAALANPDRCHAPTSALKLPIGSEVLGEYQGKQLTSWIFTFPSL